MLSILTFHLAFFKKHSLISPHLLFDTHTYICQWPIKSYCLNNLTNGRLKYVTY